MRNPEDAYKSKPDVKMPLFEGADNWTCECDDCTKIRKRMPRARRNDPETSKQAAASVTNLGRTRDAIIKILKDYGPRTDDQIWLIYSGLFDKGAQIPRVSPSGLRSRRAELLTLGFVVDSGKRARTPSNRWAAVWRLK